MRIPATRRRTSVLGAALLAIGMLAAPVAASAQEADETTSDASTNSIDCGTFRHYEPAGERRLTFDFYTGMSAIPSSSQVTSAGIEAQCLLQRWASAIPDDSIDPGAIDGYFGPQSQQAMENMQAWFNRHWQAGLAEDGWPGPASWDYLRHPFI